MTTKARRDTVKDNSFALNPTHLDILAQRKADHESGKSKARPWQEVHARISNKKRMPD